MQSKKRNELHNDKFSLIPAMNKDDFRSWEIVCFDCGDGKYSASYANAHFCSKVLNFLSRGYTQISFIGTTIFPGCPPSFPRPLVCPTFVQFADL